MANEIRIFFDFLNNIFSYLLICAIIKNKTNIIPSKKMHVVVYILMTLYAIPTTIPYNEILTFLLPLGLFISIANKKANKIPHMFLSYLAITVLGNLIIQTLHFLLLDDNGLVSNNLYYSACKVTICNALVYYVYELYINSKKMRQLNKTYQHLFNFVIMSVALTLSYITLYIFQTQEMNSPTIPMLFSSLFLLIALCIHIYHKYIDSIEKNIEAELLIEKSKLMNDYAGQIELNLRELHSLRHDIKNHLLIIDGYVAQERLVDVHNYIQKITDSYTSKPLFNTGSNVVSALLNAKYQLAREKNIDFKINYDFPAIHIKDFYVVTILGNLIDNATTAAAKCENGYIKLNLFQEGSYLKIEIANNHVETIKEQQGIFKTTKTDTTYRHGLGIKNIRSTVEQLNGQIDITYTEDTFYVDILVPNY